LNPRVRQRFPWGGADRLSRKERGSFRFQTVIEAAGKQRGQAESRWVEQMGVRERVVEERPTYNSETGAYTGTSTYEKPYTEAPGISPLLVAEMLDSTIYFSLKDLGKSLPRYEEIALPVEMDEDTYEQYDRTRSLLKDYLIQRKWEGDVSFRGAYLQWALGWPSAMFRPTEVIHNIKSPMTGERRPHTVTKLPSFGEDRIYAKEQALIDLLTEELKNDRPCVVYLRQTGTRDIQPRIEKLVRDHVLGAVPYVLKNTVSAERREKVVEAERVRGINVLITNPELVKTGLDLLFTPTLVFYEVTFSLSTMMQASARAYRLNQTHDLCKTVYMYSEGTMEHTAVQLMSRKQRAAKLLSGDIGLTGLDQLTEGEGSFESALMDAIAKDDALIDPSAMFKTDTGNDYDTEDAAFWNVETGSESTDETEQPAIRLLPPKPDMPKTTLNERVVKRLKRAGRLDEAKLATVAARVTGALERGVPHPSDGALMLCEGVNHPDFAKYPVHAEQLTRWLTKYLRSKKASDPESVGELAAALVRVASNQVGIRPQATAVEPPKRKKTKRWKPDRMAVPDDAPSPTVPKRGKTKSSNTPAPNQPTLFPTPHDYTR
jgi:hypothetical protein